jgi:small-conductance mechanosensitive channel
MVKTSKSGFSTSKKSKVQNSVTAFSNEIKQQLLGLPEEERKDFYYHEGMGDDLYNYLVKKGDPQARDKQIARALKYEAVTLNIELPKLEGSDKQVNWANGIRHKQLTRMAERLHDKIKNTDTETLDAVLEENKLSNVSEMLNMTFADWAKNSGLLTEVSAKKIIASR